ncbi:squalene--hopene cyclase [Kitasatospora sp. NPDC008050]|uniref:squalene--hopene cyclase n=1 Tax=Kitasatospora sp. NPDC008050 TaxID=3364021 RepID=UPI0036E01A38
MTKAVGRVGPGTAGDGWIDPGAVTAIGRATEHLLDLQSPEGWWKGEQSTNITMDAQDLLLREFLGIRTEQETAESARWIRSQQLADGSWAVFDGGSGELSTTVEGYLALRLAGDGADEPHLLRAADWARRHGGLKGSRVFTRIWLAMFGLWPWHELPVLPPEIVLLPLGVPLNIYDWACWARQSIVPLSVVSHLRPVRPLPFDVDELRSPQAGPATPEPRKPRVALRLLDRALRLWNGAAVRRGGWLRRRALHRAATWILERQEADGSWGGLQPPWVYSIIALHLLGHPLDHPVIRRALDGFEGFLIREETPDGTVRRLEGCQGPVWDTALAVVALTDAGLPVDHPALASAARWLLGQELRAAGDWSVRRPRLAPGGWAFGFSNAHYPDLDDTAEVVLALERWRGSTGALPTAVGEAVDRGIAWAVGMRSKDGGWGAFDADNTRALVEKLPFCDFGRLIDPPSADVTAHVVEMLAAHGLARAATTRRAVRWLLAQQEPGGSWFGRWGVNHLYGTGAVLPALAAVGIPPTHPAVRRAVRWLAAHQNADGGWGEDPRSYVDPHWIGRGPSTPSQTAWALLALLAAGDTSAAVDRGVAWLVATQRADGGWDEPQFTGTGFPGDFYIRYHLYRDVFPLTALARHLARAQNGPTS